MKIRWLILFFPAVVLLVLSLAVHEKAARAARRSAPAAAQAQPAKAPY
ncbi:MAG: hypothetical protein ABSF59_02350 [Candidatus Sulfotelmatobacter sp.]|jgi:hypothetical protein